MWFAARRWSYPKALDRGFHKSLLVNTTSPTLDSIVVDEFKVRPPFIPLGDVPSMYAGWKKGSGRW